MKIQQPIITNGACMHYHWKYFMRLRHSTVDLTPIEIIWTEQFIFVDCIYPYVSDLFIYHKVWVRENNTKKVFLLWSPVQSIINSSFNTLSANRYLDINVEPFNCSIVLSSLSVFGCYKTDKHNNDIATTMGCEAAPPGTLNSIFQHKRFMFKRINFPLKWFEFISLSLLFALNALTE